MWLHGVMKIIRSIVPLTALLLLASGCSVQNADPKPSDPASDAAVVVREYYEAVLAGNWNGVCALALPAERNALGSYCERFIADLYRDKTNFFRNAKIDPSKATPANNPSRKFTMPNDGIVTVQVEQGFIFGTEALRFPDGVDPARVGLEVVKVDGRWFWISGNSTS